MSRESDYDVLWGEIPAASAGTAAVYYPVVTDCRFVGFCWGYRAAEANTDNTIDFVIGADTEADGTFDGSILHTNANTCGLLDSAAVGEILVNMGDAGSAAGAAVAVTPTAARVAAGATIRANITTAGTGTIPIVMFGVIVKYLQPMDVDDA